MAEEIIEQATAAPGERRQVPDRKTYAARNLLAACGFDLEAAIAELRAVAK